MKSLRSADEVRVPPEMRLKFSHFSLSADQRNRTRSWPRNLATSLARSPAEDNQPT